MLPESRILAVADVVEAIASDRPYRPARGLAEALRTVSEGHGTKYDADAVDACIAVAERIIHPS
jgi:HD-GYP domain-containing protein (c-di-GMP phosphodiesterase class II)